MTLPVLAKLSPAEIERRRGLVRAELLATSKHVRAPDFLAITAADLRILFEALDRLFFDGALALLVRQRGVKPCGLKFSKRLTAAGGRTTRKTTPRSLLLCRKQTQSYEITVSSRLLFDNFRPGQRPVESCGVACASRLDALERVMEHEMLHLWEFLTYGDSRCSQPRFQTVAKGRFGHASHRHTLVTPREIRILANRPLTQPPLAVAPGQRVCFVHAGKTLEGHVARVSKRATVLVESPGGRFVSCGRKHAKFYVPLTLLIATG